MKILFLAVFPPYQNVAHAGGQLLYHYIRCLAERGHEIFLLTFCPEQERKCVEEMRFYCKEVHLVRTPASFPARCRKAPYLIIKPVEWVEAYSAEMHSAVQQISRNHFDVVHVEGLWLTAYLKYFSHSIRVVDEVDVDSRIFQRKAENCSGLAKQYFQWKFRKTLSLEKEMASKADLVFAKSKLDQDYLLSMFPFCKVDVLPPWIESLSHPVASLANRDAEMIIFTGNMSRKPNIESAIWLANVMLPLLHKDHPQTQLYIVGAAPAAEVRALESKDVHIIGQVTSLLPYYAKARVMLAPMMQGGGVITKVLEAMGSGCPAVGSDIANEGIGACDGRELFIANTADEFVKKTSLLLRDEKIWLNASIAGRQFVEDNYNWDNTCAFLNDTYSRLMQERQSP